MRWMFALLCGMVACNKATVKSRDTAGKVNAGDFAYIDSLKIEPASSPLKAGIALNFKAMATLRNGVVDDVSDQVSWECDEALINLLPLNAGQQYVISRANTSASARLSAKLTDLLVATADIEVIALSHLDIAPGSTALNVGDSQQFTATGSYADGSVEDVTASVVWSNDNAIAVQDSPGRFVTSDAGKTIVTATLMDMSANANLGVTDGKVKGLTVSPSTLSTHVGLNQQFSALATLMDGTTQDVTAAAQWASSRETTAAFLATESSGVMTARAVGNATVSATFKGVTASSPVTVGSVVMTGITITPAEKSLVVGASQDLVATGVFSDGSSSDVTGAATWVSSQINVATVYGGFVSSVGVGAASVTATYQGLSGSAVIEVTAAN